MLLLLFCLSARRLLWSFAQPRRYNNILLDIFRPLTSRQDKFINVSQNDSIFTFIIISMSLWLIRICNFCIPPIGLETLKASILKVYKNHFYLFIKQGF